MALIPTQLDWRSSTLFVVADPQWRSKIIRGGWILLIPLIGWPIILGYRSDAVFRLILAERPLLPKWDRGLGHYLLRGLKAIGIINAYYLPVWLYLGYRIANHPSAHQVPWAGLGLFFAILPILSTMMIPTIVFWCRFLVDQPIFSTVESFTIGVVVAGLTFLIPAGFLNVSKTGSMLAALDVSAGLKLIAETFPRYVEAWSGSGLIALIGHLCVPFSPFGVVWCYLAIIYSFNEVPLTRKSENDTVYLTKSTFSLFRESYWDQYSCVSESRFFQRWDRKNAITDLEGVDAFSVCKIGPFRVPF